MAKAFRGFTTKRHFLRGIIMAWWIQLILALIKYGPEIFKLAKQIYELIKEALGKEEEKLSVRAFGIREREFKLKYGIAMDYYKRHRDKSKLEELRDELKEICS